MRQLPIERDPPEHGDYRKIVQPFFNRSKSQEVVQQVESLLDHYLTRALSEDSIEIVRDFALPIQSRALTYLLKVPESEAETYIGWGVHVFNDPSGQSGEAPPLETYLHAQFDRAEHDPGDDFFSALIQASFQGRKLTRDEMMGFGNLTFAGGRDTIIHIISNIIAHFAEAPHDLKFIREDPKRITHASEEFFRAFMPLTHIGRVCPAATDVHGTNVPEGGRVSLGWAAANYDPEVFEEPEQIKLDRKPNPHLAFGFGTHLCLGAPHARLIVRTLLKKIASHVRGISILDEKIHVEEQDQYIRRNGYDMLRVEISGY